MEYPYILRGTLQAYIGIGEYSFISYRVLIPSLLISLLFRSTVLPGLLFTYLCFSLLSLLRSLLFYCCFGFLFFLCYLLLLISLFTRWAHFYLNLLILGVSVPLPIVFIDILHVFVHAHLRSEPIYTSPIWHLIWNHYKLGKFSP